MDPLENQLRKGILAYLDEEKKSGRFSPEMYERVKTNVVENILAWLHDKNISELSPNLQPALREAIEQGRWADLSELFIGEITFGTAGIRGRAVLHAGGGKNDELLRLKNEGVDAHILKGPNSINNIVLLLKSAGVAKYANVKGFKSVAVGYDSRLHGREFAELVTQLFLGYGLSVYLFDEAVPYPEIMFAGVRMHTDLGVYISASHNDKRYNGYKLSRHGAQLEADERNEVYEKYIRGISTNDIKLKPLVEASEEELIFMGGSARKEEGQYYDKKYTRTVIDMHTQHAAHSRQFVRDQKLLAEHASDIKIGYAAFHGAGRLLVPKLLADFGFTNVKIVEAMQDLDGSFPLFKTTQQPDPGDAVTMQVAIDEFVKEHGQKAFDELDVFVGTDPDADRTGMVVKVPARLQAAYDGRYALLTADEAWTALLWYRLQDTSHHEKDFVVYTHITSDSIGRVAKANGVGFVKTWVGFAFVTNSVLKAWNGLSVEPKDNPTSIFETYSMQGRNRNLIACEQSNGFTILGGPPKEINGFGEGGHVKDKDGTMATLLLAELATYAKVNGTTILDILYDKIYANPEVGVFENYYECSPREGQYEGLEGISRKVAVLKAFEKIQEEAKSGLTLGGINVTNTTVYRTGKYDALHNWQGFPDEGIRFFFGDHENHVTIRPSGTSQSLRIHVQLHEIPSNNESTIEIKKRLIIAARAIVNELRKRISLDD